jgi:hypothetical protein
MTPRLTDQLGQVQRDLAGKLAEAERIGECLNELGLRLKRDPWNWALDWLENAFPDSDMTRLIEPEIVEVLDKNRLAWLLDDIRILRRREAELRKLAAA